MNSGSPVPVTRERLSGLMPGGLTWDDLETLMTPIGRLPGLIGVAIACYNPEKDAEGACARRLVRGRTRILGTSGDRAA